MLSACTNELMLEPISQISNASFWKTESDANGALYGMYARLRAQASENFFLWGEARSEVMGHSLSVSPYAQYFDNILDSSRPGPGWQGLYTVIHDANLLIKYVPGITFTSQDNKNNILAQAHTTRAFVYFLMVRIWGDLPLITSPTEGYDPETIQRERTAKEQVFDLIKKDIDEAIRLFPTNNFPAGRNVWSKPSANALKGDINLWTARRLDGGEHDLQVALSALEEAERSDVTLLSNFGSIFDYTNKGNKEILMAVRFQDVEVTNNIFSTMYISAAEFPSNIPTDAATREAVGTVGGNNYWAPTALIRNQFTDEDQRKKVSFTEIYRTSQGSKNFYASLISKFNGVVIGGSRRFIDDIVLYRYADVLLMKAEAKNALGRDPSPEINQVRRRAYGNNYDPHIFISGSKEQNDEAILSERLLELSFEGKRWWDLIRFGKAFEKVPSLRDKVGQDYLLLFPIAETTLSLETKIRQNPGYD